MAAPSDLAAELTALIEWWREAGVDSQFEDAPRNWIAEKPTAPPNAAASPAQPPAMRAAPAPPAQIGGERDRWPAELAAFAAWWLAEPTLDGGQVRGRVPPRGSQNAPLMVLVAQPEAADRDVLLSGPQGALLSAMLAAMGLGDDAAYVASALPRHTPLADWDDLSTRGLGEVLRHHVALARPQQIIAFGRHIPPLLMQHANAPPLGNHSPAQSGPHRHVIGPDAVPLLIARDLGALLDRPIAKGMFWQHWLEWSAG